MYVLVLLLVLNGQVIEEKRGTRIFNNYLDCVELGTKIIATKPPSLNVVFTCREVEKRGLM